MTRISEKQIYTKVYSLVTCSLHAQYLERIPLLTLRISEKLIYTKVAYSLHAQYLKRIPHSDIQEASCTIIGLPTMQLGWQPIW
jgi:hypothetical protein